MYLLASAAVLEGILFAIYTVVTGGHNNNNDSGFYTENTMLQTLRFTSVTLLAFHRILRPANRLDPVRTILELEVMSVCWDALDGSTIYQLIGEDLDVSDSYYQALRVLMGFWYVSVGVRIGIMLVLNCSPDSRVYQQVRTAPLPYYPLYTPYTLLSPLSLSLSLTHTHSLSLSLSSLSSLSLALSLYSLLSVSRDPLTYRSLPHPSSSIRSPR